MLQAKEIELLPTANAPHPEETNNVEGNKRILNEPLRFLKTNWQNRVVCDGNRMRVSLLLKIMGRGGLSDCIMEAGTKN